MFETSRTECSHETCDISRTKQEKHQIPYNIKKKQSVQQRKLAFFLQVFPISVQAFNFEVHRP